MIRWLDEYIHVTIHRSVDQDWIALSPKFSLLDQIKNPVQFFYFFLHSYFLWDETRFFLPKLALWEVLWNKKENAKIELQLFVKTEKSDVATEKFGKNWLGEIHFWSTELF